MTKKLFLTLLCHFSICVLFANPSNTIISVPELEYQALVDFYKATGETNWSVKWDIKENNLHEVAWNGVTVENGHVTGINLTYTANISGGIPASFGNLKYLKTLTFYGGSYAKDLSSTDLSVFSELEALEYLDLRYCKLKGIIPASWNKLKKLKTLYLSNNALTGLSPEFGGLQSLVTADLSQNQIQILIKELENLTALRTLNLSYNKISEIKALLPSSVSLNLQSQSLNFENVVYKGVDLKIENLPNIVSYNRTKNDFSARRQFAVYVRKNSIGYVVMAADGSITIPVSYLSSLKNGDEVYLYQQYDATGNVSSYSSIYLKDIKVNQPPVAAVEYQALVDFYTAMNGNSWNNKWDINQNTINDGTWTGVSIENGHVTGLNLNNTSNVVGAIPASFGNLKYLRELSIYAGSYSKNLAATDLNVLSELQSLEYLDLRYSKIKGDIPLSWNKLKRLNTAYLDNNALTALPPNIGELESLIVLEASYNQIKIIPASIENLNGLVTLNLGNNQIEVLAKQLENVASLRALNLANNKIGTVEAFLSEEVQLNLNYQTLYAEDFLYDGTDVKIQNLPNIFSYYRSKNDFSARAKFNLFLRGTQVAIDLVMAQDGSITIPATYLSTLKKGDELYLYQQYGGAYGNPYYSKLYFTNIKIDQPRIPDAEYQALVDFYNALNGSKWTNKWDISANNLHEGAWYGVSIENGHITGLNLNNNSNVTGAIPASIKDLKYLKTLSLYGGSYSKDFNATDLSVLSELENLEYLDLRYSKIKGDLPSWKKLKKLKTLYLNNNALTSLPEDFGSMESLEYADVSYNQIKKIPASIGNLLKLTTLDLSYNQIEVLIKDLEKNTALQSVNIRNNKLSTIEALLPAKVNLVLNSQILSIPDFLYEGKEVKVSNLPNIVLYNRKANDFSALNPFKLILKGNQVGGILRVSADGTITIPADYLSTLKTGDDLYLYQDYESGSVNSHDSKIYFANVKVEQSRIPDAEYQALVDFYNALNGTKWTNKWDISANNLHEGAWYGVSIENGHITGLNLNNNSNVTGAIPASIKDLKYLKTLSLYGGSYSKDFNATDLSVLSELENLEYLDLSYSKIKGDLPSWKKLKKLKTLYLNNNALTSLPEDFGSMESLEYANLSYNQIKKIPASIGNLLKLTTLDLSYNQIEVLIKDLEKNTALQTVNIRNNKLSTIEALLPAKVNLVLNSQILSIPDFLYEGKEVKMSNLPNIVFYNRKANDFSALSPFKLILKGNQVGSILKVSGDGNITIPADYLSTLKTGDELYLYQDYESGSVTSYDSKIYFANVKVDQPGISDSEYQALVDFYNAMNGTKWTNKWDISVNNLNEGAWYGLSIENGHVTGLNLNNNSNVTGAIPASIKDLKYLKNLSLYGGYYSKNLSATDLSVISGLESLESLDLRSTNVTGVIPSSWSKLQVLKTLQLSHNNIEDADEALVHLPLLKTVDFSYQTITIPTIEVGTNELVINLPVLSTFLFNANGGVINNKNHFTLYINDVNKASSYSNSEGKLIFKDVALLSIKLTDRIRIGQNDGTAQGTTIYYSQVVFGKPLVEEEFEILKKIFASTNGEQWTQKWDISENKLHEVSWYGVGTKDGHVVSLSLSGNNLSGTLPAEISQLAYLETLNLQLNAIEGSLPSDMGRLANLKTINLQSNKFEGILPDFSRISGLKKLSVARNRFKGTIPGHLNDLESIEQIDLSSNGFDALERPFTYDLTKVYLNLQSQVIEKNEYLYLRGDEIIVNLPAITAYSESTHDYTGQYQFELQADNFKISEAVAEGNTITFPNISIANIPTGAKIAIWQKSGTAQGTYLVVKGIADGSEMPLIDEEYDALVAFFQNAGGKGWKEIWDTSSNNLHEKKWKGVTTNDGHVISINLLDNNLTGNISPEIGKFSQLQNLNLAKNKLSEAIPESLSKLEKLKTIDLSENELTGIDAVFLPTVSLKIDRQKINLGELPLTLNTVLKDQKINHYDHTNSIFIGAQSYNIMLKDYFQMVAVPEDGIKLTAILSEWNVPNNQALELRQIGGSARNSLLTYTITYREGDSNLDGIVNILDIQSTLNYTLGQKPKFFNYGAADINQDKNLNLLDIIGVINKIQAGAIENTVSTKRMALADNEDVVLSIENNKLYIDSRSASAGAFDIRLKGAKKDEIKELLSGLGYIVSVAEHEGEISIAGFSIDKSFSGKQEIAELSPQSEIVSAIISNTDAQALSYKINTALKVDDVIKETSIALLNFPNPFTDKTVIQYHLPESADKAELRVFDAGGRIIFTQSDLDASEGKHEFTFLRRTLASGVYFYVIEVQSRDKSAIFKGKMLIK